jgi:glycerol transport system substrate-binding protein
MQVADEKAKAYSGCGPRLNKPQDAAAWSAKGGAPWAKLANEKPQGKTVAYDDLIKRWTSN